MVSSHHVSSQGAGLSTQSGSTASFVQNGAFIPPVADRVMKPVQMPSMDELTAQQRQASAASSVAQQSQPHADLMQPQPAEKRRMTLLEKLSKVGFGRSGDETTQEATSTTAVKSAVSSSVSAPASTSSYRPAAGQLDAHGRVQAQKPAEDDTLDIPAFLRRNS
jgi:cell division protein FtsZ